MNIIICDDDRLCRKQISSRLIDFLNSYQADYTIEEFYSAEQVLNYCKKENSQTIDLLLLDIEMSGMDGIHLKDNLFYQSKIKYIIFISSFRERIDETFGNKTLGFLDKPLIMDKFNRLLQKAYQLFQQEELFLIYDINRIPHNIKLNEVAYLQAAGEWSVLYLNSGKQEIVIKEMLNEAIHKIAKAQMVRISKSVAVSLNYVIKANSTTIFTVDGQKFNLGRAYKHDFQESFINYLKTGMAKNNEK
ncbi:LytR/AlgR family response regulator transcription factor [Enterococcus columbae]|uniref:Response regulatory domain-containing protein n=1 Tax=Enterococcus columbae DSM 7374 = ATCC 51263 TaxID=1121865 RepID=S0K201_9ENTE|nr:LytTR family DNA-binding domain-containing protein [Enterococcus columbae]EOT39134.1 hypothetical protein OMW_02011 [Enterococcus columbae DSM 7374 = ATCC 51263]EOW79933.1 hypothetical protein I568_02284 [Enterococcus columbae DSM 7374 = ATCC 51263]OJG24556.1 hypothetical protein RR47_GL000279 [Enterococcus columbae DSM 7374 = ATCC 51263]